MKKSLPTQQKLVNAMGRGALNEFEKSIGLRRAEHWERSCDWCDAQDEGKHYCNLYSIQIKNMDIMRCDSWEQALGK